MLAHITLLGPFIPEPRIDDGVLGDLERYFADVTTFGFTLSGVSEFPGGPTYLVPEPVGVFRGSRPGCCGCSRSSRRTAARSTTWCPT